MQVVIRRQVSTPVARIVKFTFQETKQIFENGLDGLQRVAPGRVEPN